MCRGGKDGRKKRCPESASQKTSAALRKRVKRRSDKEGVSTEEWLSDNSIEYKELYGSVNSQVPFEPFDKPREMEHNIPTDLKDHQRKSHQWISENLEEREKKTLTSYSGGSSLPMILNGAVSLKDIVESAPDEVQPWEETGIWRGESQCRNFMETLDSALSHRAEDKRLLYRSTPIFPEWLKERAKEQGLEEFPLDDDEKVRDVLESEFAVGKTVNFPSYSSTSLDPAAIEFFQSTSNSTDDMYDYYDKNRVQVKGITYEFYTSAGVDMTGVSAPAYAKEREVLMPRDTNFKVVGIKPRNIEYSAVDRDGNSYPFEDDGIVIQLVEVDSEGNVVDENNPPKPCSVDDGLIRGDAIHQDKVEKERLQEEAWDRENNLF